MLWGQLSDKADVFSFGVLLLEIVTGKRNRDPSMPEDQVYLPNRVCFLNLLNLLQSVYIAITLKCSILSCSIEIHQQ